VLGVFQEKATLDLDAGRRGKRQSRLLSATTAYIEDYANRVSNHKTAQSFLYFYSQARYLGKEKPAHSMQYFVRPSRMA
jgi:hypothetical protein